MQLTSFPINKGGSMHAITYNISVEVVNKLDQMHTILGELNKSLVALNSIETGKTNTLITPQIISSLVGALAAGLITWGVTSWQLKKNESMRQRQDFSRMISDLIPLLPKTEDDFHEMDDDSKQYLSNVFMAIEYYYFNDIKILGFIKNYISPLHVFINENVVRATYMIGNGGLREAFRMKPIEVDKAELIERIPELIEFFGTKFNGANSISPSDLNQLPSDRLYDESRHKDAVEKYMRSKNFERYHALCKLLLEQYIRLKARL